MLAKGGIPLPVRGRHSNGAAVASVVRGVAALAQRRERLRARAAWRPHGARLILQGPRDPHTHARAVGDVEHGHRRGRVVARRLAFRVQHALRSPLRQLCALVATLVHAHLPLPRAFALLRLDRTLESAPITVRLFAVEPALAVAKGIAVGRAVQAARESGAHATPHPSLFQCLLLANALLSRLSF